eukprot:jgi/Tetstr1/423627/TSEL_001399.t1
MATRSALSVALALLVAAVVAPRARARGDPNPAAASGLGAPACDAALLERYRRLPALAGEPKDSAKWVNKTAELRRVLPRRHVTPEIVMLGDSISEFLGSGRGERGNEPRVPGAKQVWEREVARNSDAVLLGSAGDRAAHLLHRLSTGEFPQGTMPKVIVVLIGINDWLLTKPRSVLETPAKAELVADRIARNVADIAATLHHHSRCRSKIVVMGLLPCGEIPPMRRAYNWPSIYTRPIAMTNAKLHALAARHPPVTYLDCGAHVLSKGGQGISRHHTIDGLHPSATGYSFILRHCLLPAIAPYL